MYEYVVSSPTNFIDALGLNGDYYDTYNKYNKAGRKAEEASRAVALVYAIYMAEGDPAPIAMARAMWAVSYAGTTASELAISWSNSHGANRDEVNALRHALLAALLTKEFGPDVALWILESHEIGNSPYDADTVADRHNNAQGIRIGEQARDEDWSVFDMMQAILSALDSEILIISLSDPRIYGYNLARWLAAHRELLERLRELWDEHVEAINRLWEQWRGTFLPAPFCDVHTAVPVAQPCGS
jgi:hypothetical protein